MSTYYANDKYSAVLTSGYTVGQTTLYVSAVPNNVPTIIVAAKGTDNETIFEVTGKTTNSLTGVSRLRGANVDLDAQTPLTCLNNEEFINQLASVSAVFNEEHDETGKHTTDQINEKTEDAGVTVDGVKMKDGNILKRVLTITSSATPTINTDNYDVVNITALAENATFNAPTGTPTNGQGLIINIKDNGTKRSLSWDEIYRAVGIELPAETVAGKTMYLGLIYNANDTKWDAIAFAQQE